MAEANKADDSVEMSYGYEAVDPNEWVVVGSGDSAGEFRHLCKGRKVACVNASFGDKGEFDIDAYGVFELEAYPMFEEKYKTLNESGVQCFTRPSIKTAKGAPGTQVALTKGYDATTQGISRESLATEQTAFCSAGVAMLNAIAVHYKPEVIHIIGFDGYGDKRDVGISNHLRLLTHAHRRTKFIMHGFTRIPRPETWRIERRNTGV